MTGGASHSLANVNTVVEIYKVRQIVNPRPLDRLARPVTFAHGLQSGACGPHLRVAIHADLGGRYVGGRRNLHSRVAVPAIDPQASYVMCMTEWDGLFSRYALPRLVWRLHNPIARGSHCTYPADNSKQRQPRDRVGGIGKELRHRPIPSHFRLGFGLSVRIRLSASSNMLSAGDKAGIKAMLCFS